MNKIARLIENTKKSLSGLFDESPTFKDYNVKRSLVVGEPTVMELADMPCIVMDVVEINDDTSGVGKSQRTDTTITVEISILFSPYEKDFNKMDLWSASHELYNHMKDDIPLLNADLFSLQPKFGSVIFTRSRKLINEKVGFVNASKFTITFTEGRRTVVSTRR